MNFKRILTSTILVMAVVAIAGSCKKKTEETTYLYLDGSLKLTVERFVAAGQPLQIKAKGVTHPDGSAMGVWWYVSPLHNQNDTLKTNFDPVNGASYTITLNDVKTYTISCGVFADGYVTSSTSTQVFAVKGGMSGGSISAGFDPADVNKITDSRDNKEYFTVNIDGTEWFRNNLAYEGDLGGDLGTGEPYMNCDAMTDVFGLYYTHAQAQAACPSGWTLPSETDWVNLMKHIATNNAELGLDPASFKPENEFKDAAGTLMPEDAKFNGETMWEYWPGIQKSDKVGFAALPAGYATKGASNSFIIWGKFAAFWTDGTADNGDGYYRYINVNTPDVKFGAGADSFLASVRCVRK